MNACCVELHPPQWQILPCLQLLQVMISLSCFHCSSFVVPSNTSQMNSRRLTLLNVCNVVCNAV